MLPPTARLFAHKERLSEWAVRLSSGEYDVFLFPYKKNVMFRLGTYRMKKEGAINITISEASLKEPFMMNEKGLAPAPTSSTSDK